MPTSTIYYLDAPSLSSASMIYSDVNMITKASDGWYSDGSVSRRMVSGVLQAPVVCEPCSPSLNTLSFEVVNDLGGLSANITGLGAIVRVDEVQYLNRSTVGSGSANVPAGNASMEFTVEYNNVSGSLGVLILKIESPSGTVIEQLTVLNPIGGEEYSINATRYFAASTSVKFSIETA